MVLATRVAYDEEGNGDGGKSNGNEGDGRVTATRAIGIPKVMPWTVVMAMRLAGNEEGKGNGGKGDGDGNEAGRQ
jgi:hypothetical protein